MNGSSCGGYEVDDAALTGLSESWAKGGAEISAVAQTAAAVLAKVRGAADGGGSTAQFAATDTIAALARAGQSALALAGALAQDAQGLAQCARAYREAEACVKQRIDATGGGAGSNQGSAPQGGRRPNPRAPRAQAPSEPAGTEQVQDWINQAFAILEANGVPADQLDEAGVLLIIEHESSGNPDAENDWDSNWQAGHASKGLMQCIDTTFDEFQLPGHGDIFNPVDNIIAGVRYAISRYGSISNVPGVRAVADGGEYVGY